MRIRNLLLCAVACAISSSAFANYQTPKSKALDRDSVYYSLPLKLTDHYSVDIVMRSYIGDEKPVIIVDGVTLRGENRDEFLKRREYEEVISFKTIIPSAEELGEFIERYGDDARNGVVWVTTISAEQMTVVPRKIKYESVAAIIIDGEPADMGRLAELEKGTIRELLATRGARDVHDKYGRTEEVVVLDVQTYGDSKPVNDGKYLSGGVLKLPTFLNGGLRKFRHWANSKVKYPKYALSREIEGTVKVDFIVNRDGSVEMMSVKESPHWSLTDSVISLIEESPKWKPGLANGKPARVKYTLPIIFRLK